MQRSEQINDLAAALAKAQGEMGCAEKSSENPFFKSKYANLATVRDAIREPFAKNGLAVAQPVTSTDDGVRITTILMHASGQWLSETFDVPATKHDAQGLGSATTYGLRYSLQAITGIAPDDESDDDGNEAQKAPAPKRQPKQAPPQLSESDSQYVTNATQSIASAKSESELKALGEALKDKSNAVRDAIRPLYEARIKELKTRPDAEPADKGAA